jgi:catechol 2,3-dioxygenase-like lactoylglutathione lyase family enzyme
VDESNAAPVLLVIYTEALEECLEFYTSIGLAFSCEKHGSGPVHYAAILPGGIVFELYPAAEARATGALRLGFTVESEAVYPRFLAGRHFREDPEGRKVVLTVSDSADGPVGGGTV